jgi:pimeloyl-ACP methyl ester carboxylesterase
MDALSLDRAALVGYDWGGRGACIAAALWPLPCAAWSPAAATTCRTSPVRGSRRRRAGARWYQYYFNTERGRAGLAANRRGSAG